MAFAFKNMDWVPINKGRYFYRRLLKDIYKYKKEYESFYGNYELKIVRHNGG